MVCNSNSLEKVRMSSSAVVRTLAKNYHTVCGPVQCASLILRNISIASKQATESLKSRAKVDGHYNKTAQYSRVVRYFCQFGEGVIKMTVDTAPGIVSLAQTSGGSTATVFGRFVTNIDKRRGLWGGDECVKCRQVMNTTHQGYCNASNYFLAFNKKENQVTLAESVIENKKENSTKRDLGCCLSIVRLATIVLFAMCTGISAKGHIQSLRAVFTSKECQTKKNIIYFIPEDNIMLSNDAEREFIQVELNCVDG